MKHIRTTNHLPAAYQQRIVDELPSAIDLDAFFLEHRRNFAGMTMEDPTDPPKNDPADPPKNDPTDPPKNDPADPPADKDKVDAAKTQELGYPANADGQSVKPVEQMTDPEKAAYWKEQSSRHERAWKGKLGNYTPEQVAEMEQRLKAIDDAALSDQEKAVREAETRGETNARTKANQAVYDAFVQARLSAAGKEAKDYPGLALINTSALIDENGQIDTGKVAAALDMAVPLTTTGGGSQQQTWPFTGQGHRETPQTSGKEAGVSEAERRFGKDRKVPGAR